MLRFVQFLLVHDGQLKKSKSQWANNCLIAIASQIFYVFSYGQDSQFGCDNLATFGSQPQVSTLRSITPFGAMGSS